MAIGVAVYTTTGIMTGVVARGGSVLDGLATDGRLLVERGAFAPLGAAPRPEPRLEVGSDDIVILVDDAASELPVHAVWHAVRLVCGPYRVDGELPTQPGFDPGRALARPTGTFVALCDVRIAHVDEPATEVARYPRAMVNRYAVEEIAADLDLGFFFPGAHVTPGDAAD